MKKVLNIAILVFTILLIATISIYAYNETATKNGIKTAWHFDTNLGQEFSKKSGIHIEGWKLATQSGTKLEVYLDGKKQNDNCVKYTYKYDLISLVKGYGTYKENPKPNFSIDISATNLSVGQHTLKVNFVSKDNVVLNTLEQKIKISSGVKHILNIDTALEGKTFGKSGIKIDGWKLATEANTKLVVTIDGKEVQNTKIDMYYRYDLISIVKGYGTYKENPKPLFTINVPTTNISQGKHKLKIKFLTSNNELLEETEKNIIVDKSEKHILNIDTPLEGKTFDRGGIKIDGWKLATVANTKLVVTIDGKEVKDTKIDMYYKYDLISIVKGYGTYKENPKPLFTINVPTTDISQGKHKLKIKFVTANNELLEETEKNIIIDKKEKHIMNIDTDFSKQAWYPNGVTIDGWKLSTVPNTNLKVYVDNKEIKDAKIDMFYAYDLISIVKGYGTYKENPTPNFKITIPVTAFSKDSHKIIIRLVTKGGTVLLEQSWKISKVATIIHIETPYDRTEVTNRKHNITGWFLTTMPDATVKLLIDGKERTESANRRERSDVLNAVKGYGGKTTNPQAGFSYKIDFSKFNIGLHQIAIRIVSKDNQIIGEQVIYIFLTKAITYEEGTYGKSGLAVKGDPRGSDLKYYRYGDGPNVFFATFAIHGFEDNWAHDGEELVKIANKFYETLKTEHSTNYGLADKWTIYIFPELNPDGRRYGTTHNGPGRTTLYSKAPGNKGIDMNRSWKTRGFTSNVSSRNYAGTEPFQAYEAEALKNFLVSHKSKNGQTVLVDLHGWFQQLIGDREIGMYYAVQFPENNGYSLDRYGDGYLIDWARTGLASNGRLARTSLIELPRNVHSHSDVVKQRLAERYINATLSMLNGLI